MISLDKTDNCVISEGGDIFLVKNILEKNKKIVLDIQKFNIVSEFLRHFSKIILVRDFQACQFVFVNANFKV